jgi:hypothetical protein
MGSRMIRMTSLAKTRAGMPHPPARHQIPGDIMSERRATLCRNTGRLRPNPHLYDQEIGVLMSAGLRPSCDPQFSSLRTPTMT